MKVSMQKYSIVDNFLEKEVFDIVKHNMTYGGIPWKYSSVITGGGDSDDSDHYFASILYDHMTNFSTEYLSTVLPIIAKIQPTILIRVKANLYPNSGKQIHHDSHRDYSFSHQGAIFYINENNGPTVLDGVTEIYPKENRILFFDPSELHHSVSCTDKSIRLNINFNYLKF